MIITKTPFRMSFVGGGSDMSSFYKEEIGAVVATTINKYMFIAVNKKFEDGVKLGYSITEDVEHHMQLKHPLAREALSLVNIEGGIEITSIADIPSKGTGLGSSSSYTVGLLNALYSYKGLNITKQDLARTACTIEIDKCGDPIGKQDQYAAAFGGLNFFEFLPTEEVRVSAIEIDPLFTSEIENSLLIFYTGLTRKTSEILTEQNNNLKDRNYKSLMRRMVELAYSLRKELTNRNFESFGEILHENWMLKKKLSHNISNSEIDKLYRIGINAGAIGGKLLGAGGGGFVVFLAKEDKHKNIINSLSNFRQINFKFENKGSEVIFNDLKKEH
jgi:D-glycero-alpha-D-manno-heptose-7-phosphate kinase